MLRRFQDAALAVLEVVSPSWDPLLPEVPMVDPQLLRAVEKKLKRRYFGSVAQLTSLKFRFAVVTVVSVLSLFITLGGLLGLEKLGVDVTVFRRLPILIGAFVGTPVIGVALTLRDKVEQQQKLLDDHPKVFGERLNYAVKYNRQVEMLYRYLSYKFPAYRTLLHEEKLELLRIFYDEEIEEAIYIGEKYRRQQK